MKATPVRIRQFFLVGFRLLDNLVRLGRLNILGDGTHGNKQR